MEKRPIPIFYRALYYPLKVFFHLLYHSFAWSYDLVAQVVSLGMWADWVLSVKAELPGQRVLEIGHGTGWLQAALLEAGVEVYGLDKSRQMGALTKKRAPRSQLTRGASQAIPFPAEYFDQVAATFPSEYIYDPVSLAEISRVLIPGGMLVVVPLAWITGRKPLERLAAGLFRVTGQAGEWNEVFLVPFEAAGFSCTVSRRVVQSSQVLVIQARKTG